MVLIIYQSEIFRDYIIPNLDNCETSIRVDKSLFSLPSDIEIKIEIVNRVKKVYSTPEYSMTVKDANVTEHILNDGDIILFKARGGAQFYGIVADARPSLYALTKYDISKTTYLSVGESDKNTISYSFGGLVSQFHAELRRESDGWKIYDIGKNGLFIKNRAIKGSYRLSFGDEVNIFGLTLVFLGDILALGSGYGKLSINGEFLKELPMPKIEKDSAIDDSPEEEKVFHRSPRVMSPIQEGEIEIEAPPAPKFMKKKPVLYTIGPAFTMAIPMMLGSSMAIIASRASGGVASAFMFTGIITAIGSAAIGVIWAILNLRYSQLSEAEDENDRFNAYSNYLTVQAAKINEYYQQNYTSLHNMYYSASICCGFDENNALLWAKNSTHDDFLFFRLGLGNIPFQMDIKTPQEKFSVLFDSLKEKPKVIKSEYEILQGVPVGINTDSCHLFGIVGDRKRKGAYTVVRDIVAQIAANNCYTDIKLVFICNEQALSTEGDWEFVRWLPHVWSQDKKTRFYSTNKLEASDVFYELANAIRRRGENTDVKPGEKNIPKPFYIVFVEDKSMLEGELIQKYILNPSDQYGMTTFIMTEHYSDLPNECTSIIQNDHSFRGTYDIRDFAGTRKEIAFDEVSVSELVGLAKRLSDIKVNESESTMDIPTRLDFLEMYGVRTVSELSVADRWRKNRTYNSLRALMRIASATRPGSQPPRNPQENRQFPQRHHLRHGYHGLR